MKVCPSCGSFEGFCEDVDLEIGEVKGYHCTQCGYDSEEDELS